MTINGVDVEGVLITAAISADRRRLTDHAIASAAAAIPLMTLKVMAAIHYEALKLWIKGVRLTKQPAPALEAATYQATPQESRLRH